MRCTQNRVSFPGEGEQDHWWTKGDWVLPEMGFLSAKMSREEELIHPKTNWEGQAQSHHPPKAEYMSALETSPSLSFQSSPTANLVHPRGEYTTRGRVAR